MLLLLCLLLFELCIIYNDYIVYTNNNSIQLSYDCYYYYYAYMYDVIVVI